MRHTFAIAILTSLAGSVALSACRQSESVAAHPTTVTLRQEWFANSNFSGAVLAASTFAAEHGLVIKIEEGSENVDPIALVAAGKSHFGDAAADRVLAAVEKGADLVIIGVVNPTSPVVFLAKAGTQITTPKAFEGKKVGVLSGTATEMVYRTLLLAAKVDTKKVTEIEAGFDLQGFVAGVYDVRPAFAYDEPVTLRAKGIDITTIDPRDYGVRFVGTVYFARRQLIRENRALVQNFLSAVADGWRLALIEPERAIKELKKRYPSINEVRELEALKLSIPYLLNERNRIFTADARTWNGTIEAMRLMKLASHIDLKSAVDESFVNEYYAKEVR